MCYSQLWMLVLHLSNGHADIQVCRRWNVDGEVRLLGYDQVTCRAVWGGVSMNIFKNKLFTSLLCMCGLNLIMIIVKKVPHFLKIKKEPR